MSRLARNAAGAAAGLMLDRLLGEPPTAVHPVALFGTAMSAFESRVWADQRSRGVAYTAVGVATGGLAGSLVRSTAVAVGVAAAGRQLRHAGSNVAQAVEVGDLALARELLPWLVGRDPSELDESGIAAAVIESLAENTVDAVVAPVFWALIAGAPGALAYRAVNTMDAMVGHKSERFLHFGWSAARLDDIANYLPARLFHRLVELASWPERHSVNRAVHTTAAAHPSPNAGVAEAAVAGALGVELGGPLRYGNLVEDRPRLGAGPRPNVTSMFAAITLVDRAEQLLLGALAVTATAGWLLKDLRGPH